MIGKSLHTILKSSTYIQSVLTEDAIIKVFPSIIPDSVNYPSVEYSIVSSSPIWCKQGDIATETYRVQIDVFDTKYDSTQDIASSIKSILHNLSGVIIQNSWLPAVNVTTGGWVTPNGAYWDIVEIDGEIEQHIEIIQFITERDIQEMNDDAKGIDIFHKSMDFYIKLKKL